jgi:hypothetical protein
MAAEQIAAIERDIAKAKVAIDFGLVLERLKTNKDFKEVVLKGYFEQEAVRLVHLKAEPFMQSPDSQRSIVTQMDAIGSFSGYLNAGLSKAAMAKRTLEDAEVAMTDIYDEESTETGVI